MLYVSAVQFFQTYNKWKNELVTDPSELYKAYKANKIKHPDIYVECEHHKWL